MKPPLALHRTLLAALAFWAPLRTPSVGAAILNVPADHPTIQAAVDAASSDDTIRIASGLYEEQIVISRKNLTLEGAPGATIRMVEGHKPILGLATTVMVGVDRCTNVVMRGLIFDGDRLGDAYSTLGTRGYGGVLYSGSGGTFEHCIVRGFRHRERLVAFNYKGFQASNPSSSRVVDVTVRHCRFSDNGLGIHVRGNDDSKLQETLRFLVADNDVEGVGPTRVGEQIGICISSGATGAVIRNRVAHHDYLVHDLAKSFGILALDWYYWVGFSETAAALRPIRIEDNTLVGNQWGISSINSHHAVIANNFVEGASPRAGIGISVTGSTNRIAGNTISRTTSGIVLIGNDPEYKTALGRAIDPILTDNRFCDVDTNVVVQPLVTGVVESGTQVCPFPEPRLTIEPAVMLSFPSSARGWTLESAPSPTGPWTVLERPPTIEGTSASTAIGVDESARFFRLLAP